MQPFDELDLTGVVKVVRRRTGDQLSVRESVAPRALGQPLRQKGLHRGSQTAVPRPEKPKIPPPFRFGQLSAPFKEVGTRELERARLGICEEPVHPVLPVGGVHRKFGNVVPRGLRSPGS